MASRVVQLHLAFHHHQPFGNLPGVMEDCCRRGYLPFLRALDEAAPLRFNLSYSGPLLQYLAAHFPEYIHILQRMVRDGRVEILSTGFYEPILADLGEEDRQGQLARMREWWGDLGVRTRGLWLAEGVWASDLPGTMARAGLDYTVVSRERLLQGGVPASMINGHFLTEHQGQCCRLFPHENALGRLMPFGADDELFAYLRRVANRGDITLTFADQAERWAVWPDSRERVLDSGYLRRLLARFQEQSDWVRLSLFSDSLDAARPVGRCYLPPGVSKELGVWSLPDETRNAFQQAWKNLETRFDADQFLPYFRVGCWDGFRARYAESNWMHKRGLWLKRQAPADPARASQIGECLHEAQCNTAYWYGTSGGIYAPHLREAVWRSLLKAQALCHQDRAPRVVSSDLDTDGCDEMILESPQTGMAWSPARGGALLEWSHLSLGINLGNTMTRYRETMSSGVDGVAIPGEARPTAPVDPWTRHSFQELIFKKHTTVEELAGCRQMELGDFIGRAFEGRHETLKDGKIRVTMERMGAVMMTAGVPMRLRKTFVWDPGHAEKLRVDYEVENCGKLPIQAHLGIQFNLALPGAGEQLVFAAEGRTHNAETLWFEGATDRWSIRGAERGPSFQLLADRPITLWSYPVFSASSEAAAEIRQGNAIVSGILLNLSPGESTALGLRASFGEG
jgi:4-alpha-glucanotransferase